MNASKAIGTKSRRLLALILAAAVIIALGAIGVTLTAKTAIEVTLTAPNSYTTLEVGAEAKLSIVNLADAYSSDSTIAAVTFTKGSGLRNLVTLGVKAGTMATAYGTSSGKVLTYNYQITDSRNITKYILDNGGEGVIPTVGGKLTVPIHTFVTTGENPVENAAAKSTITWSTFRPNDTVASVNATTGEVTGESKGATIILGQFTDKWGRAQDIHFLVAVGIKINDSRLDELIDLIEEANRILALDPNPYTEESLDALEQAKNDAEAVVGGTEDEIAGAIDELNDAINGLDEANTVPDGLLGPDGDGNYFKPVGEPANVYEVVDGNGDSKQPPEYVYNENGTPQDGGNVPAIPKGGDYYIDLGHNIYQKVENSGTLGEKVGGGPDENPATNPVTPIIEVGGNYYVGPLGPDGEGNYYYYGDKTSGGDNLVNSTADAKHSTDDVYYLVDGQMTTTKPSPTFNTPSGSPTVANTGRFIDKTKISDSSDWLEIATMDGYSLIIRVNPLPAKTSAAQASTDVMNWYKNTFQSTSALRPYISKNDAGWKNGDVNSLTAGRSKPTGVLATITDNDTCFPLSYGEYAQYCSNAAVDSSGKEKASGTDAKANYVRITNEEQLTATYVSNGSGRLISGTVKVVQNTESASVHPAMWILTSAFETLGK